MRRGTITRDNITFDVLPPDDPDEKFTDNSRNTYGYSHNKATELYKRFLEHPYEFYNEIGEFYNETEENVINAYGEYLEDLRNFFSSQFERNFKRNRQKTKDNKERKERIEKVRKEKERKEKERNDLGESSSNNVKRFNQDDDGFEDFQDGSSSVGEGMSNKYKSVKIHKLSPAQQRKLKKGNKVIIKGGADHEIMLSPEQEKKFNKKSMMGCGITIQLDPYQQDMVMSGAGFKDFVGKMKKAKIGKKIIKFAKDNKILKRVSNALVERAIKTIAGSGVETVKRKRGRPRKGGALMAAGGGGALKPAGNY
jgi:hypothetical protein